MNLGMLLRTIHRHWYMRDRPAYAALLRHVDTAGDVWKASQAEVAAWWERRQESSISLSVPDRGTLHVSCPLDACVVEVDGAELRAAPFTCSIPTTLPAGDVTIRYHYRGRFAFLVPEILGHLGYRHLAHSADEDAADIAGGGLEPILAVLHQSSTAHQRYDVGALARLRELIAGAHHRYGLPDVRIWTLPHRSGRPFRVGVSTRYDVDKAIVNLPAIHELEARHGLRSTVYLRPMGPFYGPREIIRYCRSGCGAEVALHGEFITTSRDGFADEFAAARGEKQRLEEITGTAVYGVCMHGGELRSNTTPRTRDAIEGAGFRYETMYRNHYHHPLHVATHDSVRRTLSIGQHYADISVTPEPGFSERLLGSFIDHLSQATAAGGIFVPVLHPLYFDLAHYLRSPANLLRLIAFMPKFISALAHMRGGDFYYDDRRR